MFRQIMGIYGRSLFLLCFFCSRSGSEESSECKRWADFLLETLFKNEKNMKFKTKKYYSDIYIESVMGYSKTPFCCNLDLEKMYHLHCLLVSKTSNVAFLIYHIINSYIPSFWFWFHINIIYNINWSFSKEERKINIKISFWRTYLIEIT